MRMVPSFVLDSNGKLQPATAEDDQESTYDASEMNDLIPIP